MRSPFDTLRRWSILFSCVKYLFTPSRSSPEEKGRYESSSGSGPGRLYQLAAVSALDPCWMDLELMGLVHPLPKTIPPLTKDFGPKLRKKQLLGAKIVEVSSTLRSDC